MMYKFGVAWLGVVFMLVFLSFTNHGETRQAALRYDAVVDSHYAGTEGALLSKVKTYKTVQKALQDAPADRTQPYVIYIKNGEYYEKLTIDKPCITFLGETKHNTILTFDANADTIAPNGSKYGTSGSASITVTAPHFTAENLTIENSWDYNANMAKDPQDPTKVPSNTQAVALKTDKGSDRAIFRNVKITGFQDTLYVNSGTAYFDKAYISGNVDFIFGAGQVVFNDCDIVSRDRKIAENNGYVTAPSTKLSNEYGLLFLNCRLKKESPAMADESVTLGRPWHPTTNLPNGTRAADPDAVGAVAYINCYMDSHIAARGWDPMSGKDKDGSKIWFYPQDSRFYEYGSTGPGAKTSPSRQWLTETEAKEFTIANVLGGWKPE